MINVLLVGSGAREHALAWKISQSPLLKKLYIAPGNAGTSELGTNLPIKITDNFALVKFAQKAHIGLVIIGPDDALAAGLTNSFSAVGIKVFGPSRLAARIESSKPFAKKVMNTIGIDTAPYRVFRKHKDALAYVGDHELPLVIKVGGLAQGKGVRTVSSLADAEVALDDFMLKNLRGQAGQEIIIEKFLLGNEVSIHAFCDGQSSVIFPSARDHKRISVAKNSPNTGGMGVYAPVPELGHQFLHEVQEQIVDPVISHLARLRKPFVGCLYPGLMVNGFQKTVLEFNARFGDPETQVYMRLLESDLLEIMLACVNRRLHTVSPKWSQQSSVCIVLASQGYPDPEETEIGFPISGLKAAQEAVPEIVIFQAGTSWHSEKGLITAGGRVLSVTALGDNIVQAADRAYQAVDLIHFEGMKYRPDIARP